MRFNYLSGSVKAAFFYWLPGRLMFLICLVPAVIFAQEKDLRFEHFTTEQGLSNDIVTCITQDQHGFIWIGTMEGLNRYDGRDTKVFRKELDDEHSLSDNIIYDIYSDRYNQLWVGTQNGICLYNPDRYNFTRYILDPARAYINPSNRVTGIEENLRNELVVAVELGSLFRYKPAEQRFEKYPPDFLSIKDFLIDEQGLFWVGGVHGLSSYNSLTGEIRKYETYRDNTGDYPVNEVNTLFEEGDTIWAGTIKGRIYYILKSTREIHALEYDFDKAYYINDIYKNSAGLIIIATADGLYFYDKEHDHYSAFQYDRNNPYGLNAFGVTTVFEDSQNNLWVGTYQGGVNLATHTKEFHNYNEFSKEITLDIININTIMEDSKGDLWLGSFDLGINVINPETNERELFLNDPDDPGSLGYGTVFSLFEDSRGNIWVGTYLGFLQRFDPETKSFQSFPFDHNPEKPARGLDIRSIHEDGDGMLWLVAHGQGLSRLDPQSGEFKHFIRDDDNPEKSLADNYAFQIIQDHVGYFWIATPSGLSRFDRKAETFRNYYHTEGDPTSLCNNFINVVYEDSDKKLWIGTKYGLSLFDRKHERFVNFFEGDGLPSNDIKAILEHKKGELWMSTGRGITRMRYAVSAQGTVTAEFRNYDESDNLQDIFFWDRSACRTRSGRLIFGSEKGIVAFYPDDITENIAPPNVLLTSFRVFNREMLPGTKGSVLEEHISKTGTIRLKHDQNFFSFKFVAFNYIANEKNAYKYKLEGFDSDWIDAGESREASYTNVEPGRYVFRVIASNNDGHWNEAGASVEIIVDPPFYQTWWFRTLMVLMITALILAYYFRWVRGLRRKNLVLEEKVQERISEISALNKKFMEQNKLLEEQKNDTQKAYNELNVYKSNLEELVEKRARDLIIAKEKAEEADRLKTSFLTNLSHEIRTPLNSIIGFSGLIFDPDLSESERKTYKDIIDGSTNTLLGLINDIIDFSKLEAGHLDVVFKEVILDRIFDELQNIYSLEIKKHTHEGEKNIQFRTVVDEKCRGLILITDEIRLKQILSILINNAIKFTHEGSVEVGCNWQENKKIEFYVLDTGIGIDEQHHQAIFERFRKIENGQRLFRGAGIGLSIASELSQRLGGEISLDSKPGKGARFSLIIPVVTRDVKRISRSGQPQKRDIPDLAGRKVMIAEDDYSNYAYLEKLLRRTNASVVHAKDGMESLQIYKDNPDISMIFMDIKMPRMNGLEALRNLQEQDIRIPVIAQTAYAFSDEIRRIREAGFQEYLAKPINASDLYDILNKYFP